MNMFGSFLRDCIYFWLSPWGPAQLLKTAFNVLTMDLTGDDNWAPTLMRAFLLHTKEVLTFPLRVGQSSC